MFLSAAYTVVVFQEKSGGGRSAEFAKYSEGNRIVVG